MLKSRLLLLVGCLPACAELTAPTTEQQSEPLPATQDDVSHQRAQRIEASHILIAYEGAKNAPPTVTRSKDAARQVAQRLLNRLQKGADFDALARKYSADPASKKRGGKLGRFTAQQMVQPFSEAAFKLDTGELSGVVQTAYGFHIIKRTE